MKSKKRTFGVGICGVCRNLFIKKAPNQNKCDDCSYWRRYEGGSVMKRLHEIESQLKDGADLSGNPKVWTAEEYDQEFLQSLIPTR